MKKIFLSAAALIALAAPAFAADMSVRPLTQPLVSSAGYNWTGFYTASSIGGAWYDVNGTYVLPPRDGHSSSDSSGIYGSHVGLQYQWSNWVIGVEGAYHTLFNGNDWGSTASPSADCIGSGVAGTSCQDRVRNYWTVGGKLGMAFGNWMLYGTGGFANGRVQTRTVTSATNGLIDYTSERHDGWFGGVGADLFVTKFMYSDLIIGVEYQHVELDTKRHFDRLGPATVSPNAFTRDVDANIDVVRAKATFKWTPGG